VATLARELDARAEEGLDWAAEARMAARRLVERRLKQQLKERRQQLDRAPDAEHAARLNQEILDLARTLRDLSNKE
jgi:hypothetical protein